MKTSFNRRKRNIFHHCLFLFIVLLLICTFPLKAAFWDSLESVNGDIDKVGRMLSTPTQGFSLEQGAYIYNVKIDVTDCQINMVSTITEKWQGRTSTSSKRMNLIYSEPPMERKDKTWGPALDFQDAEAVYFGSTKIRDDFKKNIEKLKKLCLKKVELVGKKLSKDMPEAYGPGVTASDIPKWGPGLSHMGEAMNHKRGGDLIYLLNQFEKINLLKNPDADFECIQSVLTNAFGIMNEEQELIKLVDLRTLVEVIKNLAMITGADLTLLNLQTNFIINNDDFVMVNLMKQQVSQVQELVNIYQHKLKITEKEFLDFLKLENDILWVFNRRINDFNVRLSTLKNSDEAAFSGLLEAYKKNSYYETIRDLSHLRIRLALEKFKMSSPNEWEAVVKRVTDEEEGGKDPEYDFNHYGRFGVAGDTLDEMVGYDKKVEKSKDPELMARHLVSVDFVTTQMRNVTDYASFLEKAFSAKSIRIPTLSQNVLDEAILLKSEFSALKENEKEKEMESEKVKESDKEKGTNQNPSH